MNSSCKQILISIIIPVYNVEKYLKQCLESVINQTYSNIEVICINDCSTDKSLSILNDYVKLDSRIQIINNEQNLGAGLSRNKGINTAKGEYILFLDSDDWLEKDALEILTNYIMELGNVDFINYGVNEYDNKGKNLINKLLFNKKYINYVVDIQENPTCIEQIDLKITKLVSRDFITKYIINFNKESPLEDLFFSLDIIFHAKNVLFINESIYNYRILVKNSISSKICNNVNLNINYLKHALNLSENKTKNFQYCVFSNLYKYFLNNMLATFWEGKIIYKDFQKIIKENIDIEILNLIQNKYYCVLYKDILQKNVLRFKVKYLPKYLIKKLFYFPFTIYMNYKNRRKHETTSFNYNDKL